MKVDLTKIREICDKNDEYKSLLTNIRKKNKKSCIIFDASVKHNIQFLTFMNNICVIKKNNF